MSRRANMLGRARRRGVVLISVLLALALVAALAAAWLRIAGRERAQLRVQQRRIEAECLVASGQARAAARLATDAGYSGETWTVAAASLGGRWDAKVAIEVAPEASRGARRVRVVADFPASGPLRVRRSEEQIVELPKQDSQP